MAAVKLWSGSRIALCVKSKRGRQYLRPTLGLAFGCGDMIYDPWHHIPVLAHKPGALRIDAPFRDWAAGPTEMEGGA